jgi:hypothetical protein
LQQAPPGTFVAALLQICCSSVAATSCVLTTGSGCKLRRSKVWERRRPSVTQAEK